MIVANLATFPPRRAHLREVLLRIAPQVDRLNLVLNEYAEPPAELSDIGNLHALVPAEDTKDAGKFLPDTSGADFVFLVDDDILYPPDYVKTTLAAFTALGRSDLIGGYHSSCYRRSPSLLGSRRRRITPKGLPALYRRVSEFRHGNNRTTVVDQLASNSLVMRAAHMPPFEYMRSAQKFVDVRLARWAHERSLHMVELPRPRFWIGELRYPETIYRSFTLTSPPEVSAEILAFAHRVPHSGRPFRTLAP